MHFRKIFTFLSVMMLTILAASSALATESAEVVSAAEGEHGLKALAAALAIGLAALGGAIGQGISSSSAFQGIARNPNMSSKIFTFLILSLALIESLVIYALVIAFMLMP